MTSADFSAPLEAKTSHRKFSLYFQQMIQDLHSRIRITLGFAVHCPLAFQDMPCILFLFVITCFCLQLPPHNASQHCTCFQLTLRVINVCSGLTPYSKRTWMAHNKKSPPIKGRGSLSSMLSNRLHLIQNAHHFFYRLG